MRSARHIVEPDGSTLTGGRGPSWATHRLMGKPSQVARQPVRPLPCQGAWEVAATCDAFPGPGLSWADDGPVVTAVVRYGPVVRGPDVAPMWPCRSGPWKARLLPVIRPDATPMPQVRPTCDGPLLSVRDRQMPVSRARGGHDRRGRSWLRAGSDGHKLNRRVRLVHAGHLSRWQASGGWAAGTLPGRVLPVSLKACAILVVSASSGVGSRRRRQSWLRRTETRSTPTRQPADEEGQDARREGDSHRVGERVRRPNGG
jgi:hypothetical protein